MKIKSLRTEQGVKLPLPHFFALKKQKWLYYLVFIFEKCHKCDFEKFVVVIFFHIMNAHLHLILKVSLKFLRYHD